MRAYLWPADIQLDDVAKDTEGVSYTQLREWCEHRLKKLDVGALGDASPLFIPEVFDGTPSALEHLYSRKQIPVVGTITDSESIGALTADEIRSLAEEWNEVDDDQPSEVIDAQETMMSWLRDAVDQNCGIIAMWE